MAFDMPPGAEHMHSAEVMGSIQSMEDAVAQARKIANLENPDENTGEKIVETRGSKMTVTWEKNEGQGTLIAHITLEKDGETESRDVTFTDMTGGKAQNPIYEEGSGPPIAMQ